MSNYLIAACSGAKVWQSGAQAPAMSVYDGPAWRMIRKAYREHELKCITTMEVYALSAEFGLIRSTHQIPVYNRKMDPARSGELQPFVQLQAQIAFGEMLRRDPEPNVLVFGGRLYADLVSAALEPYADEWRCTCDGVNGKRTGIGYQLGELSAWLDEVLS